MIVMVSAVGRDGGSRAVMLDKIVQLVAMANGDTNICLTTGERIEVGESIKTLTDRINAMQRGAAGR